MKVKYVKGFLGSCLQLTLVFCISSRVMADDRIHAGTNVMVSAANASRSHYETLVAADPTNPNLLIGCAIIETPHPSSQIYNTIVYRSDDSGLSWTPVIEPKVGELGTADPACTFGLNGAAYFVTLGNDEPRLSESKAKSYVYSSADGGLHWKEPVELPTMDREFISVDTTLSKYRGRIYIHGNGFHPMFDTGGDPGQGMIFYRSLDGGSSFLPYPMMLNTKDDQQMVGQSEGVVLSDGTFVTAVMELLNDEEHFNSAEALSRPKKPNAVIKATYSTDGGESFAKSITIDDIYTSYSDLSSLVPAVDVDRTTGPFKERIYVAWTDLRSGRAQILLSKSSDKGKTWSAPVTVNDDIPWQPPAVGPDDAMPMLAVNPSGVVGIAWYDRRDNGNDPGYYVRFAASLDGGDTFLPSVRVSSAPTRYDDGRWAVEASGYGSTISFAADTWPGHTAGMAADAGGTFHPFWIDNRTGRQEIWTSRVTVDGQAAVNGSPDLAKLKDVSDKVELQLKNPVLDRATSTVLLDLDVHNKTKSPIRGPLKLRVLSLRSAMGWPTILNADSGNGVDAILDLTNFLPGGVLGRDARSRPRRVAVRLTNLHPIRPMQPDDQSTSDFVSLEVQALAAR